MPTSKSQLIQALHSSQMANRTGLSLDTPSQWIISGLDQPEAFFKNLSLLLPSGANLYLEGCTIIPEVAAFYEAHRASQVTAVLRDTLIPTPAIYHVGFSLEVATRLGALASSHALPDLFDHVKGYHHQSLLFWFHDAFSGDLLVSEHVPEAALMEFCKCLGVVAQKVPVVKPDPKEFQKLMQALDKFAKANHPPPAGPWWKRWWQKPRS